MKYLFIYSKHKISVLATILLFILFCQSTPAQSFYGMGLITPQNCPFFKVQINSNALCFGYCSQEYLGNNTTGTNGLTMSPGLDLFSITNLTIFIIDTLTGMQQVFYDLPPWPEFPSSIGLVSTDGEIFYTISEYDWINGIPGDSLFRIDTNTGIITNLGYVGWAPAGDITLFNGEFYFVCQISNPPFQKGIVKLDINNPSNNELVVAFPVSWVIEGLTASNICNTLIAADFSTSQIVYVNIIDGAVFPSCELPVEITYFTSMLEFASPTICEVAIDLDCDDSSGATNSDFNSPDFDCLSDGVDVADEDIGMMYDAYITTMTIELTGSLPDAPYEILEMTGSVTGIDVSGSGTNIITLTNQGAAKSTDFKDALRQIRYDNTALPPTAGQRTVEVHFTTEAGSMSNVATAYIQVNELPLIPLDLGPDQEKCEGESATFDAGNLGAIYQWNTGAHTQTITVNNAGEYIVTVENGINCPNQDTVLLTLLPIIHLSLTGDDEICDNEQANLTLTTDSPFPLDIEITPNPGSPFTLMNVEGSYDFFDLPSQTTEYTITNVIPSEPACVEISDPSQVIYVHPTYFSTTAESICEGDSIWLGYYWETQAGTYEILFDTEYGCDSTVVYTIDILPAVNLVVQSTTCDPAEVGIFISFIDNPTGCDTVVQTTVSLLSSDTTIISQSSCNSSSTGVFTQLLTNQDGCDSLVINTVSLIPPADTTSLQQTTCDSSLLGIFQQILPDQTGCDSLIITTITIAPSDTSYLTSTSCDSSAIGVFEFLLSNQSGCDSLVITTVSAGTPDTTYLSSTSCDSSSLGTFEYHFTNSTGCDSVVLNTVTYSSQDSTFQTNSSCNLNDIGVFISLFVNEFGCDSIVTLTVSLLSSDSTFITNTTCDPDQAGIFITDLHNQNGCDSIVTETVSLLSSDATFLSGTTCISSEAGVFISNLVNQNGCDSIVTKTITLTLSDTTTFTLETCDPDQVGNTETLFIAADGCDSLVIESTVLFPLPVLLIESVNDFNDFDISCEGGTDGSVSAIVAGVGPYTYLWSTGDPDQTITGLSAGDYAVSITDSNGCETSGSITLTEPDPFMIIFEISEPDCFEDELGIIQVQPEGGVAPYTYSIDGINFQTESIFENLSDGIYQLTSRDANDCETKEIISIHVPLSIHVGLGNDQTILLGDSAELQAIVNLPFDSIANIQWTGIDSIECQNCLTQIVAPVITTAYSISVSSVDGCSDTDSMSVIVSTDHDFYVPNIFSPNGDGINDVLTIGVSEGVDQILAFSIFDRWGNLVFGLNQVIPNDPGVSWDGRFNGKMMNPGVFTYKMNVQFEDGRVEIRYGDITVIR